MAPHPARPCSLAVRRCRPVRTDGMGCPGELVSRLAHVPFLLVELSTLPGMPDAHPPACLDADGCAGRVAQRALSDRTRREPRPGLLRCARRRGAVARRAAT